MTSIRTSQFIVGLNKYLEAVSHGFSVGMRFRMRFEGEDSPERRFTIHSLFLCYLKVMLLLQLLISVGVNCQVYRNYCWNW